MQKRTGVNKYEFPIYLIKELIDNAIDNLESSKVEQKQITINYSDNNIQIFDNGTAFNEDELDNTLTKFDTFTSSKRHYIKVKRGTQGNALKTIAGICFIESYQLQFFNNGNSIQCDYKINEVNDIGIDKTITSIATTSKGVQISNFNISDEKLKDIILNYYLCNYHIEFVFNGDTLQILDSNQTKHDHNIHFYSFEDFKNLLSGVIQYNQKETTIRFVNEFDGIDYRKLKRDSLFKLLNQYSNDVDIYHLYKTLIDLVKRPTEKIMNKYILDANKLTIALNKQYSNVELVQTKSKKLFDGNLDVKIPIMMQFNLFKYSTAEPRELKIITNVNQTISISDFPFICDKITTFLNRKCNEDYLQNVFYDELKKLKKYNFVNGYILHISFISPKIVFFSYNKNKFLAYNFQDELQQLLEISLKELITATRKADANIPHQL